MAKKKSIIDNDGAYIKLIKENPEFDTPPKGEQWSICPCCGEQFEQYLIADQNRYTSFKKCPNCRQAHRKKVVKSSATADNSAIETLNVCIDYTPHEKQKLVHKSIARFRLINAGARFGKDRCSMMCLIEYFLKCLNEDRKTDMIPSVYAWLIAPTERIAKQNWNELKRYFPKDLIADVSNSTMSMQTVYGGLIEVRSAYDPEALVGVGLDAIVITEAARIADMDIVWANLEDRLNSPGRGLDGNGGIGIINSSPKGRNYFYRMWTWGQENHPDYDPDWESWTFTTWDNPEMAKKGNEVKVNKHGIALTYKERLRKRKGDRRYRQDNLAEFIAGQSNCFPNFEQNCVQRIPADLSQEQRKKFIAEWRSPIPYNSYVIGYDPASINDIPAAVVGEAETGRIKRIINMTGFSWTKQYDFLTQLAIAYNNAPIAFGRTGHETIDEALKEKGNVTIPINEQGQNKSNLVNRAETAVENSEIQVLYDGSEEAEEYIFQFNDYSATEKGNSTVYSNVEAPHDDYVSATYFMLQGIKIPDNILPFCGLVSGVNVNR